MNLRRTTLKGIISSFLGVALLPGKSLACISAGGPSIDVHINKRHFRKFHYGNIENFLYSEYKNAWSWSKDVIMSSSAHIAENMKVVPINVLYDINYNEQEIYCSNIDIVYADESSSALYVIASVHFGENAIPCFSTRIRMSSVQAKLYAALTFRNIKTNELLDTKISYLPVKLLAHSCAPLNFIYIDA